MATNAKARLSLQAFKESSRSYAKTSRAKSTWLQQKTALEEIGSCALLE